MVNSEFDLEVEMAGTEHMKAVAVDCASSNWHGLSQTLTSELPKETSFVRPFAVTCKICPPAKDEISPEVVCDTDTGLLRTSNSERA